MNEMKKGGGTLTRPHEVRKLATKNMLCFRHETMKSSKELLLEAMRRYELWKAKAWDSSLHPQGADGRFVVKGGDAELITNALKENVAPIPKDIEFSETEFNRLFGKGVDTPLGKVSVGKHQYEKLRTKDNGARQKLLPLMYETLADPAVVVNDSGAKLFCKEFGKEKGMGKIIVSVVIDRDGKLISISTHEKRLPQIVNKNGGILYRKSAVDHGTVRRKDAADITTMPQSDGDVKENLEKSSSIEELRKARAVKVISHYMLRITDSDGRRRYFLRKDGKLLKAWDSSLHPRGDGGKFAKKGGENVGNVKYVGSTVSISDDDFTNPRRSVLIAPMTSNFYEKTGVEKKQILIKKNIFEKNLQNHSDLSPSDSKKILNAALYETSGFINDKPSAKPNYWLLVKFDGGKNGLVCLDTDPNKKYHEVVNWRYANNSSLDEIKKRAAKEGAQFLITESREAPSRSAGLSDVQGGDSNSSQPLDNVKENLEKSSSIEELRKALQKAEAGNHRYTKRIPNPNGKGYIYFYTREQIERYKKTGETPEGRKMPIKMVSIYSSTRRKQWLAG